MTKATDAVDSTAFMMNISNIVEGGRSLFPYRRQCDPHELFITLTYYDSHGDIPTYLRPLCGKGETLLSCTECKAQHGTLYDYTIVMVSPPNNKAEFQFSELLHQMYTENVLSELLCNECDNKTHNQFIVNYFFPKHFFFNIKRWRQLSNSKYSKMDYNLVFPDELQIQPQQLAGVGLYRLKGFIVHYGKLINSGHYVTYIKTTDTWYLVNDHHVSAVATSDVFSQKNFECVYMLLYDYVQEEKNTFRGTSCLEMKGLISANASIYLSNAELQILKQYLKVCNNFTELINCLQYLFTLQLAELDMRVDLFVAPSKWVTDDG